MKNKLKVFRAIHNITQEELAQRVKVTRQTINAIENEKYDPSIELAFKFSKLFKVKIEEIFSYDSTELADNIEKAMQETRKAKLRKVDL